MSEQWHDDHRKAIAEKWTQCPPVTTKVKELIGDEVCMGTYGLVELEVMQLETELAEAQAEIERLNKSFGDSLDTIFAMLLAARGAECDIDTLKAEMKPVSSKPSEYIKHTIAERDKLIEQMREALRLADDLIDEYAADYEHRDNVDEIRDEIKAALSAAERR